MEAFCLELGDPLELLLEHRGRSAVFLFPALQSYPPMLVIRAIPEQDNTSRRRKESISVDSHFSGVERFCRRRKTSPCHYSNCRTFRLQSTAMSKQPSRSRNASCNHPALKRWRQKYSRRRLLWSDNLRRFGDLRSGPMPE